MADTLLPSTPLQVDFSWKKCRGFITSNSNQVYIIKLNWTTPDLEFKHASDNSPFGTGNIHVVKIDADCQVRDRPFTLKAMKRFATHYSYPSLAYSQDLPSTAQMTWKTSCSLKKWDFICLDPAQRPVARFSSNVWAFHKLGQIEFMNQPTDLQKEEIVVTGLTLYYFILYRMNSLPSLVGAVFSKPGKIDGKKVESGSDVREMDTLSNMGDGKSDIKPSASTTGYQAMST